MQMMTIFFKGGADVVLMGEEAELVRIKVLLESRMGEGGQPTSEITAGRTIEVLVNSAQIDRIEFVAKG